MYIKRLLKAVIYFGLGVFIIIHDNGPRAYDSDHTVWSKQLEVWADSIPGIWGFLASILVLVFHLLPLILLVKGYYYFKTLEFEEGPFDKDLWVGGGTYESKDSKGKSTDNIEKILEYRNSKMYAMDNKMAAEEFKSTAWVDGLFAGNSENTTRVRNYVNSELAARTNEQGYQWLKKQ
jgi:hypothetical protein